MTLVLISNNLGIMWVGIEATTLLTAFLICIPVKPASLEAMWKYLMICSIGVAFAFLGTLMVAASASGLHLSLSDTLLWTRLRQAAASLNPMLLKAGFLCLLVGYGTKAGLAPMHNWLPDAHSQAPAPVSALFSGFMLSAALYCVLRYLPIVEATAGLAGWGPQLLVLFGIISILVAAAFIIFQHDVKTAAGLSQRRTHRHYYARVRAWRSRDLRRSFPYSESLDLQNALLFRRRQAGPDVWDARHDKNVGIVAIGAGVGSWSVRQPSRADRGRALRDFYERIPGAESGGGPPRNAPIDPFLAGGSIVFVGALRHAIAMAWGEPSPVFEPERAGKIEVLLVFAPLAILLILGLWMPGPLMQYSETSRLRPGGSFMSELPCTARNAEAVPAADIPLIRSGIPGYWLAKLAKDPALPHSSGSRQERQSDCTPCSHGMNRAHWLCFPRMWRVRILH